MMTFDYVKKVKEKYAESLMKKEDVAGVGIGRKKNSETEFCLRVYVTSKKNKQLHYTDKIPIKLDGVPVEIIETGKVRFLDDNQENGNE